ncbi:hypothetical protein SVIOM74S_03589 [Streptomyces violarus]
MAEGPPRPERPGRPAASQEAPDERPAQPLAASLVQSVDWLAIAPPTIAAVVGLVVLVADLFVAENRKTLLGWTSVAGLAAATLMLLPLLDGDRSTFCLTGDATVCSYTADRFTLVIQFLVLGGALLAALLSVAALKDAAELPEGETGSSCCPPRPAPPSCPPPATSRP